MTVLQLTQQMRCKDHFRGFGVKQLWQLSSPDINPMDFVIWSILDMDVLTCTPHKMNSLKAAIQSAWTKLNDKVVRRSCASVKARLRLMIKAKCGDFEIWSVRYVFNIVLKSFVNHFSIKILVLILFEIFDG